MLTTGNYKTESGETVHLTVTETGYVVRYADGTVTTVSKEA